MIASAASADSFRNLELELSGFGTPERVMGARVAASLLETLGVAPLMGRNFTDIEDQEGREVVLLSHACWQKELRFSCEADRADYSRSWLPGTPPASRTSLHLQNDRNA